jgi:integrase
MAKRNVVELKGKHTIKQACDFYMHTPKFAALRPRTQKDYMMYLSKVCDTPVQKGKQLGNIKLMDVRFKHVTTAYDRWLLVHGVRSSNYMATCLSIVFNTSIRHEAVLSNPVTLLQRTTDKPRKIKWTREQVRLFLDTAYSEWKWRSVGLIVHMAYEWAQRVGDMRLLRWDNLDLDAQRLDLEQSKRRADVHLPITDESLCRMLRQQKEDFDFQDYVAPRVFPRAGAHTPYDDQEIHVLVNQVKEAAGLPIEIQARDLRRTGITEMVESGVDMAGIMQVSGHTNPQSVKPYLVNTFSGASAALAQRRSNDDK